MATPQYLFGKTAIIDALKNNLQVEKVMCLKPHEELLKYQPHLKFEIVSPAFFNQFKEVNHQQVVGLIKQKITYVSLDQLITKLEKQKTSTILVIDGIEDSHNFGALIRTAVAFKVDAIIYKNHHQAPLNEVAIKTSMGAVYYIDFVQVANLNQAMNKLKQAHWWVYTSSLASQAVSLNTIEFDQRTAIIVGNEHLGVSKILHDSADFLIKIEMENKVQSLNVSVAAGIILHKNYLSKCS